MARVPEFKQSDIMAGSTFKIEVKVVRDWRFRLGLWVMKVGARIIGCKVEVEQEGNQ